MVVVGAWAATGNRLHSPGNEVLLVGAGVALLMLIFMVQACLQGEHRFRQLARVQSAPSLIYAGCVLVLCVGGIRSSVVLLYVLNLGAGVVAVLMAAAFLTSPPPDLIDGQLPGALPSRRDLASFGSRLTFAGVAPIDGLAIDALVIGDCSLC